MSSYQKTIKADTKTRKGQDPKVRHLLVLFYYYFTNFYFERYWAVFFLIIISNTSKLHNLVVCHFKSFPRRKNPGFFSFLIPELQNERIWETRAGNFTSSKLWVPKSCIICLSEMREKEKHIDNPICFN